MTQKLIRAFAARRRVHNRNYAIFMVLEFTTGLVGLITTVIWCMLLGSILASAVTMVLTAVTGVLAVLTAGASKVFPIALKCPACETRLDELESIGNLCPNCDAHLK